MTYLSCEIYKVNRAWPISSALEAGLGAWEKGLDHTLSHPVIVGAKSQVMIVPGPQGKWCPGLKNKGGGLNHENLKKTFNPMHLKNVHLKSGIWI